MRVHLVGGAVLGAGPIHLAVQHIGYCRLILVTTGIGLTAALPIIQQLRTLGREIFLIWVTRNLEQVSFHLPMLLGCTAALVFCDGDRFPDKLHRMLAMVPNLALYKGRPNLEKICCWIILAQHGIDSNEASASPVRPPSGRGAKVAPAAIDSDALLVLPADPSDPLRCPGCAATLFRDVVVNNRPFRKILGGKVYVKGGGISAR